MKISNVIAHRFIYALFFLITIFFVDKYNYSAIDVEIKTDKVDHNFKDTSLVIFNNKELSSFTLYPKRSEHVAFRVLGKEVWGICHKNVSNIEFIKFNGKSLKLKKLDVPQNGCRFISSIQKFNKKTYSIQSVSSSIVAGFIVLFFVYVFELVFVLIFKKNNIFVSRNAPYISYLAIQILYFIVLYPGLFNMDFSNAAYLVKSGHYNDWFSFLNPLYLGAMFKLGFNIGTIQIPLILYGCLLVYYYYKLVLSLNISKGYTFFILIIFSLPPISMLNNFITRDVISLYLVLSALFILLNSKYGNVKIKREALLFITVIILSGIIRREGLAFFYLMLLIYPAIKSYSKKKLIKFISTGLIAFYSFSFIGEFIAPSNNQVIRNEKITFTLAHYIGSIITNDYVSEDKVRDKEIISEYYDYDILKNRHVHYDVLGLHFGARKWKGKKSIKKLVKFAVKLILDNPQLFFKSRLLMFSELLFPTSHLYTYVDDYEYNRLHNKIKHSNELLFHDLWVPLQIRDNSIVVMIRSYLLSKKFQYLYSTLLSLLILLLCLIFYKKLNTIALIAVPFLFKSFVMFILMQKAQFQYFSDIYVAGFILLPFIAWEFRQKEIEIIK